MSQPSLETIQKYLLKEHGLELHGPQTRRYRSVLGNPEKALVSLKKKIEMAGDPSGFNFLSRISMGSKGEARLKQKYTGDMPLEKIIVDAMTDEFTQFSSTTDSPTKYTLNKLVDWLDTWVGAKGMVALRGILYSSSQSAYKAAGLLDEDVAADTTHQPSWIYEKVKEILSSDRKPTVARNCATGTPGYDALFSALEEKKVETFSSDSALYFHLGEKMLEDLLTLEPKNEVESDYSKALATWKNHWVNQDSRAYFTNLISTKRYTETHNKLKISVKKKDQVRLTEIKSQGNFTNLGDAVSDVLKKYIDLDDQDYQSLEAIQKQNNLTCKADAVRFLIRFFEERN